MANKNPCLIDGVSGEVDDLPYTKGTRYRCKLDTLNDVKREMTKLYRESRSGLIDVQDSTKHVWVLQAVAKIIETSELEKRLEVLEAKK